MTGTHRLRLSGAVAALVMIACGARASGGGGGGGGFSMPSASAPRYDVAQEYRNAVQALQDGKYREADKALGHVLDVAPKEPNSLYMMGLAKTGENDPKGAEKFFQRAVKADPDHIGAHRQLALTEAKLGQTDKATAELTGLQARAAKCADACPQAVMLKAAVTEVAASLAPPATAASPAPVAPAAAGGSAGGPPASPSSLMFAAPDEGDHAYLSAVKFINQHRYQEALSALKTAQIAFGPHPDILTYMGYVNRKLGHLDLAQAYYERVLAMVPTHVGATEYYGELKVVEGDIPGARRLLARLETDCTFGCVEGDDLRRWIAAGHEP